VREALREDGYRVWAFAKAENAAQTLEEGQTEPSLALLTAGDDPGMDHLLEVLKARVERCQRVWITPPGGAEVDRLAAARRRVGRVSDAVTAYAEALALAEQAYGARHLETGHLLTELGDAYRFLGVYHKAEECLHRALRIHETECGMEAPETLHDLHLFTGSCEASGNIEAASAQHERRLGLKLRVVGADLEEIARWQMTLSELYMRWSNTARARELVMEAIGSFRRERGPRLAGAYEALASIEEARGQYPEALHELERAARVWETLPGQDYSNIARNLQCRAQLLDRMRLPRDAAFLREKLAALALTGRFAAAS